MRDKGMQKNESILQVAKYADQGGYPTVHGGGSSQFKQ